MPNTGLEPAYIGARRLSRALILGALVWLSMGCAAAFPAIQRIAMPTPTPKTIQRWAAVQIEKASPTPTSTATIVTTPTAARALEPTATGSPLPDGTAEPPLLTMVIVDSAPEPSTNQEATGAPISSGKYILVSISEQHLYAYENGQLVYSFVVSTGLGNSTRLGTFHILDKIPNAYGANWNIWMPNWMGIYWSGTLENGIHALPILPGGGRLWAGYLGAPISYGCVVLGVDESLELYNWADVGTPVEIRW